MWNEWLKLDYLITDAVSAYCMLWNFHKLVCQPLYGKLFVTLFSQGAREDGPVDMDGVREDAQVSVKHMD